MMKKNNKKNIALLLLLMMLINFGGQSIVSAATPPPLTNPNEQKITEPGSKDDPGTKVTATTSNISFSVNAKQTTYIKDGGYWDIGIDITNNSVKGGLIEATGLDINDAQNVIARASIDNPDKVFIHGDGYVLNGESVYRGSSPSGKNITIKANGDAE